MSSQPKIVVHSDGDTPSEAIVKAASKMVETTDALGRKLKVRKLNAMMRLDLARIVGAEGVNNPAVMAPCSCAFAVSEIDGEGVYPPNTYNELRALVGRLDDEGIAAVEIAYIRAGWVDAGEGLKVDDVKNS